MAVGLTKRHLIGGRLSPVVLLATACLASYQTTALIIRLMRWDSVTMRRILFARYIFQGNSHFKAVEIIFLTENYSNYRG